MNSENADFKTVMVSAAVIFHENRVLVSRRKAGTHLAGMWEFPGGKVEPGEDPRAALARELREEIGVDAHVGEVLDVTFHRYEDAKKCVLLMFFEATVADGSPAPRAVDVAEIAYLGADALDPAQFPPADVPLLGKIRARLAAMA